MKPLLAVLAVTLLAQGEGCQPLNCPYPAEDEGKNILYTTHPVDPKDLDPAISYNENEYVFLGQIYEPPLQYHYLKRPYELAPLTLTGIPKPRYLDADGKELPADAPAEKVSRTVYECHLRPGIRFQDHPCFAKDARGKPRYVPVDPGIADRMTCPEDFPEKGSRELTADDYVHGLKRLGNPILPCPIRDVLEKYVLGMAEYDQALKEDLEAERARRKAEAGAGYNRGADEQARPIALDLDRRPCAGIERVDRLTFRITLKAKYPQILYWMAMPFFSPIPPEAEAFYGQPELVRRNITLNAFPVGTGPFLLERFDRNRRLVLARNPNFRDVRYPSEGEPGDAEAGLLEDAGKRIPFLDKAVYRLEKEATPSWNKFLQGYYDISLIASDNFEKAVSISPEGSPEVSGELARKGISLHKTVQISTSYMGFNMKDPVVGGYDERHCKLRQAIGIALDTDEFIQIFRNGRGTTAQQPIPPGIFGYEEDAEGTINPFLFSWDPRAKAPRRRSLEEARKLLAEAGYPQGIGPDGKQLVLGFDNNLESSEDQPVIQWIIHRFQMLGIRLESRTTDYRRFQEKMHSGNFQVFQWGWNADYPDPENFLFLLYGPNSRSGIDGPNSANYANPAYDALFRRMENMENGPERLEVIRRMNAIFHHDAPWIDYFYPVQYTLSHAWLRNSKPNLVAHNILAYKRIDTELRSRMRREWNRPRWTPVWAALLILVAAVLPAWATYRRRERGGA